LRSSGVTVTVGMVGRHGRTPRALLLALAALIALAPASASAARKRTKPDLVVSAVSVAPAQVAQGASIDVADTTRNKGKRKARASKTRYLLSGDRKRGGGDVRIGQRSVKALKKGRKSRGGKHIAIAQGFATGDWFVLACADATRKVKEKRERNNCRATGKPVSIVPRIVAVNRAPTATPKSVTTAEDAAKAFALAGTDPDGETLSFSIVSGPSHGTLTGTGANRVYHPAAEYHGPDSFVFRASDPHGASDTATVTISVTNVDDVPVVTTSEGVAQYAEGDPAVDVDPGVLLDDVDSATMTGATVRIAPSDFQPGDELNFVDGAVILGIYDTSTGVLTLTGTAPKEDYEVALQSITFVTTSDDPVTTKLVQYQVSDDNGTGSGTRAISILPDNDAPTVTTTAGNTSWTEGTAAVTIDSGVTVSDVDDATLPSAQVRISSGFQAGDELQFVETAAIQGVYDTGTGVLTLTPKGASATPADYQAAMQSIKFSSTNANPSASKTVEFTATDDDAATSVPATKTLSITAVP
jgi:hypothetical protein